MLFQTLASRAAKTKDQAVAVEEGLYMEVDKKLTKQP
jgi:hypothetical protein